MLLQFSNSLSFPALASCQGSTGAVTEKVWKKTYIVVETALLGAKLVSEDRCYTSEGEKMVRQLNHCKTYVKGRELKESLQKYIHRK